MSELFIKAIVIFVAYFTVRIGLNVIATVAAHYLEKRQAKKSTLSYDSNVYNITTMRA